MPVILTPEQLAVMVRKGAKIISDSGPARLPGERPSPNPAHAPLEVPRGTLPPTEPVTLWLDQPVKGKARPRAFTDPEGVIRTRKPKAYAEWLRAARRSLVAQWAGRGPLRRCSVEVTFWGGSRRNDGDNGIGSVLDALVKAGVIVNDNLTVVPRGSWAWEEAETPRIEVRVIPS